MTSSIIEKSLIELSGMAFFKMDKNHKQMNNQVTILHPFEKV